MTSKPAPDSPLPTFGRPARSAVDRSPFHPGEVAMQRSVGADAHLREIGARVIRDRMPEQHRDFFTRLPTLVVGSVDAAGRPWASMLAGRPGFVSSPDAARLRVDALPNATDPLRAQLAPGAALGMLGLEPQTRRRNRVNGTVEAVDTLGFTVAVEHSFGNCPKYIQARDPVWVGPTEPAPLAEPFGARLPPAAAALVAAADTLFIASAAPGAGADVSHRGGKPGFVRVQQPRGSTVLTLPDFIGNFFFNTLGNLTVWPWAGLLFVDPDSGGMLQLVARATVVPDGPEVEAFAGAERLLRLDVVEGVWRPAALPWRATAPGFAAQLQATGHW